MSEFAFQVSGQDLMAWRKQALGEAKQAEIDLLEVDWLLLEVTDLDRLALRLGMFQNREQILLKFAFAELIQLWRKRLETRSPIQYLVGVAPWREFALQVGPGVLIPRPETELMIEIAIAQATDTPQLRSGHWADLGTGSGAIALGLATAFPEAIIHAVDQSEAALKIARQNAQNWGLSDRIQFYQGSWFTPLAPYQGHLQAMISNPPYIPTAVIPTLQPEVALYEPLMALDGGEDGLESIRILIETAPLYLTAGGLWLVELMAGQAPAVIALLKAQGGYEQIQAFPDLAGIERFVGARSCG